MATDLRAGAALVCAAIAAEGTTYITNANKIDRGYENIVQKLTVARCRDRRVDDVEFEQDAEA